MDPTALWELIRRRILQAVLAVLALLAVCIVVAIIVA